MICPLASVPSASTAGLYFEKYGSFFTYDVRSASWPLSPSVRASVNGTSNTVGSVPAASFAANVGAVHWYSTGWTLIPGFVFSNCATCWLNCSTAAAELPGISDATLIVTAFAFAVAPAAEAQPGAVEREHRTGVVRLRLDRQPAPVFGLLEPARRGAGRAEPVGLRVAAPGERDPAAVPAGIGAVRAMPHRIAAPVVGNVLDLGQAELLALVDVERAGQRHREERGGSGSTSAAREVGRNPLPLRGEGERGV